MRIFLAHKGAVWCFNQTQFQRILRDIKERRLIDLGNYGGRMITGRLQVLDEIIREHEEGMS